MTSIEDVLGSATVNGNGKKTKSKVPIVETTNSIKQNATILREKKEKMDSLKTEISVVENEILQEFEPIRTKILTDLGYQSAIKIVDTTGKTITLVWSHSYSKIPLEMKNIFINHFQENTDNYIKTEKQIVVKGGISDEGLKELINLVGAENFGRFFEVERWLAPTEKYTEDFHTFPDEMKEEFKIIAQQRKPSLKTK